MAKIKRLAKPTDPIQVVTDPVSDGELLSRQEDYLLLSPSKFAAKYRDELFHATELIAMGKQFLIQINHCTNPTCRQYGMPQQKFEKNLRYRLNGVNETQSIVCNTYHDDPGGVWSCFNWSAEAEIARLVKVENALPLEPTYQFHREGCADIFEKPHQMPMLGPTELDTYTENGDHIQVTAVWVPQADGSLRRSNEYVVLYINTNSKPIRLYSPNLARWLFDGWKNNMKLNKQ